MQRVEGLRAMVQEQVSLIESVARFNQQHSSDFSGGSKAATLSQVIGGYSSPVDGPLAVSEKGVYSAYTQQC